MNKNLLNGTKAIVVTHLTISFPALSEVYGQGCALADYLKGQTGKLLFIKHPLNGRYPSKAELYLKGIPEKVTIPSIASRGVIRYILDTVVSAYMVLKSRERWDVYVGVNGLNTIPGLILKRLYLVKHVIFYTADYAPVRFDNRVLNWVYHWIDRYCVKNADYVWNISRLQVEIRDKQGVPPERNVYVPHGFDVKRIKRPPMSSVNRRSLVLVANLAPAINFALILDAFADIVKKVPDAKLIIIGTGEMEDNIKEYVQEKGIVEYVEFKGWLPREEVLEFLPFCGVALAVYTTTCSWTEFSDSFKVKEYLACGCPTIVSGSAAVVQESEKSQAVIAIDLDKTALTNAMQQLFLDDELYARSRENAFKFMEGLDWEKVYGDNLAFLVNGKNQEERVNAKHKESSSI